MWAVSQHVNSPLRNKPDKNLYVLRVLTTALPLVHSGDVMLSTATVAVAQLPFPSPLLGICQGSKGPGERTPSLQVVPKEHGQHERLVPFEKGYIIIF
jgi:hypothetical protein